MKFVIAVLLIFVGFNLQAQLKWADKPLTWKDFSGPIDNASPYNANTKTSTNYQYQVHFHNNIYTVTFDVECLFLLNGSWVKPNKQTNILLQHEQLHFDIEELFARKLMAAFKAATYTANYKTEIKNIYDPIAQQAKSTQQQYDLETNHGGLNKEQLKWEQLVHAQLKQTAGL